MVHIPKESTRECCTGCGEQRVEPAAEQKPVETGWSKHCRHVFLGSYIDPRGVMSRAIDRVAQGCACSAVNLNISHIDTIPLSILATFGAIVLAVIATVSLSPNQNQHMVVPYKSSVQKVAYPGVGCRLDDGACSAHAEETYLPDGRVNASKYQIDFHNLAADKDLETRLERLELESILHSRRISQNAARISSLEERVYHLELALSGREGDKGIAGMLGNCMKHNISGLLEERNTTAHAFKAMTTLVRNSIQDHHQNLTSLANKVEKMEMWMERLHHDTQKKSTLFDGELSSLLSDLEVIRERLHSVENHVFVTEDIEQHGAHGKKKHNKHSKKRA